jgi:hypothetical protein
LADQRDKRNKTRLQVKWPITIYTKKGPVKRCEKELRLNEVCRMRIRPPQKQSVEVEGKLIWSNLEGLDSNSPYSGMGFSFIKCSDEDLRRLDEVISRHLEKPEDKEGKEGVRDEYEL